MLAELIKKTGIIKACIVDDANDSKPQKKDLTGLSDEWDALLDDIPLNEQLIEEISNKVPSFDIDSFSKQGIDDFFIETLWEIKDKFSELSPIFEAYESTKLSDKEYVQTLQNILEENKFEVTKVGRDFFNVAIDSHIIFIDLFLYLDQTDVNLEYTIDKLKDIIKKRGDNPPVIVLISRSNQLKNHAEKFRDECGIMESGFRIYRKTDLTDKNKVQFCIKKLLDHYEDSKKVLKFLTTWELHAKKAVDDTIANLKKIDLLDHNMIHRLLLKDEGQSSASYFMDLFDSVLIHNFECQSDIIESAKNLNTIDFSKVPTIQGLEKDFLQDLVFKSVFMGTERCQINEEAIIELGDIFTLTGKKNNNDDYLQACTNDNDDIWLVITPSCDLVRGGVNNIGLLKGYLTKVEIGNWQTDTKINTPIIKIKGVSYSVRWDVKTFITYPKEKLQSLLKDKVYYRVAKMREVAALCLQQQFTANYSRIGQRAVMPSVFKASISMHYLDKNDDLIKIDSQEDSKGLFYVGSSNNRVVNFSHVDFNNILSAFDTLDTDLVHNQAKHNVQKIKDNPYILIEALEGGLEVGNALKDVRNADNSCALAKIVFGELNESIGRKLRGVGLIFSVQETKQEEAE